jgi:hypothetical protein
MMKQTLINKYMAGTATVHEEQELRQVLMSVPREELSADEKVMLQLLCSHTPMEEDVFDADYSEEYERIVGSSLQTSPKRGFGKWWKYASVAAAIALVCGTFVYFSQEEKEQLSEKLKAKNEKPELSTKGKEQRTTDEVHASHSTLHASHSTLHASRSTLYSSRSTPHASRSTPHASRSTLHDSLSSLESDITSMQMLDIDLAEVDIKGQDLREAIMAMNEELFANY